MKSLTKKILAGVMAGSLIFCGVNTVYAAEPDQAKFEAEINEWAKDTAEWSHVSQKDILNAIKNGKHYEDIEFAAILSKISGKPFNQVLSMKTDWIDIMQKLGVTREKYSAALRETETETLAKDSSLDTATVKKLLEDHYRPRDIAVAGRIAKLSNKNVQDVLDMKKINKRWIDIADELKVDKKVVFQKIEMDEQEEEFK